MLLLATGEGCSGRPAWPRSGFVVMGRPPGSGRSSQAPFPPGGPSCRPPREGHAPQVRLPTWGSPRPRPSWPRAGASGRALRTCRRCSRGSRRGPRAAGPLEEGPLLPSRRFSRPLALPLFQTKVCFGKATVLTSSGAQRISVGPEQPGADLRGPTLQVWLFFQYSWPRHIRGFCILGFIQAQIESSVFTFPIGNSHPQVGSAVLPVVG